MEVNLPRYGKHNITSHIPEFEASISLLLHIKEIIHHTQLRYFKDEILSKWTKNYSPVPYTILHKDATPQRLLRRGRCRAHMSHSLFHTPNTLTLIAMLIYHILITLSTTLLLQSRSGLIAQYTYIYTTELLDCNRPALFPSLETTPSSHSSDQGIIDSESKSGKEAIITSHFDIEWYREGNLWTTFFQLVTPIHLKRSNV